VELQSFVVTVVHYSVELHFVVDMVEGCYSAVPPF